jgi:SAM-dependent methyltransferase
VLDLGSGPGANTWFLAREGFAVWAIDGSPSGIAQNRARLTAENLTADLHVGDFTMRLPWAGATLDAVLDNASSCANPLRAITSCFAEVRRVLKPGGVFISLNLTDRTWVRCQSTDLSGGGAGLSPVDGGHESASTTPKCRFPCGLNNSWTALLTAFIMIVPTYARLDRSLTAPDFS